jgi:hypothetical protein
MPSWEFECPFAINEISHAADFAFSGQILRYVERDRVVLADFEATAFILKQVVKHLPAVMRDACCDSRSNSSTYRNICPEIRVFGV